jgi:DNA-binding transcriptional LysR family regulator
MTFCLAASRDYVSRFGMPNAPEDLAKHNFIAVGQLLDALSQLTSKQGASAPLRVVLRYRTMDGVANAIAAGIGIAPVPAVVFEDPRFKDVMVPILPEHPLQRGKLYALYATRKFLPLGLRAFVDFSAEFLGRVAAQERPSTVASRFARSSPGAASPAFEAVA